MDRSCCWYAGAAFNVGRDLERRFAVQQMCAKPEFKIWLVNALLASSGLWYS